MHINYDTKCFIFFKFCSHILPEICEPAVLISWKADFSCRTRESESQLKLDLCFRLMQNLQCDHLLGVHPNILLFRVFINGIDHLSASAVLNWQTAVSQAGGGLFRLLDTNLKYSFKKIKKIKCESAKFAFAGLKWKLSRSDRETNLKEGYNKNGGHPQEDDDESPPSGKTLGISGIKLTVCWLKTGNLFFNLMSVCIFCIYPSSGRNDKKPIKGRTVVDLLWLALIHRCTPAHIRHAVRWRMKRTESQNLSGISCKTWDIMEFAHMRVWSASLTNLFTMSEPNEQEKQDDSWTYFGRYRLLSVWRHMSWQGSSFL